jgi:GTP-binding protein
MEKLQKHVSKKCMCLKALRKKKADEVKAGEICALVGLEGFEIGDTVADVEKPEALKVNCY